VSSPPHTDISSDARADGTGPFSPRERWALLGSSLWLVTGLQLDAYAHATNPELETFWTPWHAVLNSGIAACGFVLLWLLRPRLPHVMTYRSLLRETPQAPFFAGCSSARPSWWPPPPACSRSRVASMRGLVLVLILAPFGRGRGVSRASSARAAHGCGSEWR
jgi:hypothetical protein